MPYVYKPYQFVPKPYAGSGAINVPLTASGATGLINFEGATSVVVTIDITAISGASATITVSLDAYDETSGKYVSIANSSGLTATGTTRLVVNPLSDVGLRVSWTITGTTPSITCTISGKFTGPA